MAAPNAAIDLLHRQIADADTQWSLGRHGLRNSTPPRLKTTVRMNPCSSTRSEPLPGRGPLGPDASLNRPLLPAETWYQGCRIGRISPGEFEVF